MEHNITYQKNLYGDLWLKLTAYKSSSTLPSMRKIIHVDMDCFYAAVEMRDNPRLRNIPIAVGGKADSRGVVTTANYIARKYGVRSAMPSAQAARLCPDLVFVPPNFAKYREESLKVREIFSRYTDVIEPLSLDEAYLDVTQCEKFGNSATLIAKDIRKAIFTETGLTASAGIAPNKFLAKVASDWKKPNGQWTVAPQDVSSFVKTLRLSKIPGVGRVTYRKMQLKGFETCEDLQAFSQIELIKLYGKWGKRLYDLVRGIDDREVKTSRIRKSLSVETTFLNDLHLKDEFLKEFEEIFKEFQERFNRFLTKNPGAQVSGYVLKLRFTDFRRVTREKSSSRLPSLTEASTFSVKFFEEFNQPIRLLGFGVRLKSEEDFGQLEFEL